MFDIGWSELLVIGVVALVVIGPKELPAVIRGLGQAIAKLRRMAGEFQGQFNEALREAELGDLKKSVDDIRSFANPLSTITDDVRQSIEKATSMTDVPDRPPPSPADPGQSPDAVPPPDPPPPLDLAPPEPAQVDLSELTPPVAPPAPPTAAATEAEGKPA